VYVGVLHATLITTLVGVFLLLAFFVIYISICLYF
jgi:hypothetical protein